MCAGVLFESWRAEVRTTRLEEFDIRHRLISGFRAGGLALLNIGSKPLFAATGSPSVGEGPRPRPGNDNRQATAGHLLVIESRVDLSGQIHPGQQQSNYQLTSQSPPTTCDLDTGS